MGASSAGFDACIEMDADLSHEPEALPGLVAALSDGCELVIGSRYVPGGAIPNWAWHRRLLSRGGNVYASALLGLGRGRFDAGVPGLLGLGARAGSSWTTSGPTATGSRSR